MRPALFLSQDGAYRAAWNAVRSRKAVSFKVRPRCEREPDGTVSRGHVVFLIHADRSWSFIYQNGSDSKRH